LLASGQARAEFAVAPTTINVVVEGKIGPNTWDPEDELTISGQLRIGQAPCQTTNVLTNIDSAIVLIVAPDAPGTTGAGHKFCGPSSYRQAFAPGTNSSGNFSVSVIGGGVSFQTGDGYTNRGARFQLLFKEGADDGTVNCGTETRWPENFGCDYAPDIYGVLASPDLTGDLQADQSDISQLSDYVGDAVTRAWAWQADFNHDGYCDQSDVSYYAGRSDVGCSSSKASSPSASNVEYDMTVSNLLRSDILELLELVELSPSQVIADWSAHGWSYDTEAAALIAADQRPTSVMQREWGGVKHLYR
jgi:hypothetical protein